MALLLWVRGPGLALAGAVFLFGMLLRLFEIHGLGRKADLAPARPHSPGSGWRTLVVRMVPSPALARTAPVTYVAGYLFHLGFFVTLLFLPPHIEFIRALIGVGWPALPTPLVDGVAVLSIIALLALLVHRLLDPVKRFLSTPGDYMVWALTLLPLLTGYLAYHHLLLDYTLLLALHLLSVELLLVAAPFTKLAHMVTLFIARWYNGDMAGRKGVAS